MSSWMSRDFKKIDGSLVAPRQTQNTTTESRSNCEFSKVKKKAFLRHGKGLRRYTQSAEDDYARTRQWTFKDKGSRYQVCWGVHRWGGGDVHDRGGVVATRGREKSHSSGRAGTLFRWRAYTKISRPKHKRADGGGTTKAEKKLHRAQKYGAGRPGTECGAHRPVRRVLRVVAYHFDNSCVPPGELRRAGWPRNTLLYLGVYQAPPE